MHQQMLPPAAPHQPMLPPAAPHQQLLPSAAPQQPQQHLPVHQPVLSQPPPQLHPLTSQHLATPALADQPAPQQERRVANQLMQLAGYGQPATDQQEEQSEDEVVELARSGPSGSSYQPRASQAHGHSGRQWATGHRGGPSNMGRANHQYSPSNMREDRGRRHQAPALKRKAAPVGAAGAANRAAPIAEQQVRSGNMTFRPTGRPMVTANMLPDSCWSLSERLVSYHGGNHRVEFSRSLPDESINQEKSVVWPSRKVLLVDNLELPALPLPAMEGNEVLKKHPHLHLKPIVGRCNHGEDGECRCILQAIKGQYHRNTVIPELCLKNGRVKAEDLLVKPQGLATQENLGHFYVADSDSNDHLLALPSPFFNNGQWANKVFMPAHASGPMDQRTALYYALYNAKRARENALLYQSPPSEWRPDQSPYFGEPAPESELGMVSKHLYGVETLQRIGYPSHPNAEPRALLFVATDWRDRKVPVYCLNRAEPLNLDSILADVLRPWYQSGQGQIVCPICLIETDQSGQATLCTLARGPFISHWREKHSQALMAISVFSGTQLNLRVHQGHLAYLLALANRAGEDSPHGRAVDRAALRGHGLTENDNTLMSFLGPLSEALQEALLLEEEDMDYGPLASEALGIRAGPSKVVKAQGRAKK